MHQHLDMIAIVDAVMAATIIAIREHEMARYSETRVDGDRVIHVRMQPPVAKALYAATKEWLWETTDTGRVPNAALVDLVEKLEDHLFVLPPLSERANREATPSGRAMNVNPRRENVAK